MKVKVQEVAEVICGEVMNSPLIGSFEGFTTKLEDVKRGSLFFAINPDDIEPAIKNGAFGIVFDKFVQMIDGEIAWIKVSSIVESIVRLARYRLLVSNIKVFYLDEYQYKIAQIVITAKNVLFFDENPALLLDILDEQDVCAIFIKDSGLLDFVLEYTICSNPKDLPFDVVRPHILFESRFYYKLNHYKIPLPEVFLPELGGVVSLCVNEGFDFDIYRFSSAVSLLPLSLDQNAKVLPFGQSSRVVIPTQSKEIFLRYASVLNNQAKWGKIEFFLPTLLDEEDENLFELYENEIGTSLQPSYYNGTNDLPLLLKRESYNFGLVFGIGTEGLKFVLDAIKPMPVPALF